MEFYQDFKELLALLDAHRVEYVIVGAYALGHHGCPRYTADLDILVRPGLENGTRVVAALRDFGVESLGFSSEDFADPEQIIQIGVKPVRVDILTSISGVSWEEISAGKESGKFGEVDVYYIGREQFIANKRASGRKKDLGDIEAIGGE
jgi:hypothetical protein